MKQGKLILCQLPNDGLWALFEDFEDGKDYSNGEYRVGVIRRAVYVTTKHARSHYIRLLARRNKKTRTPKKKSEPKQIEIFNS